MIFKAEYGRKFLTAEQKNSKREELATAEAKPSYIN